MLTAIQPSVFASEIFSCHFGKIITYGSILVCEAIETYFQTLWYMFLLLKCTWHTTLYEFQEHNSVINNRVTLSTVVATIYHHLSLWRYHWLHSLCCTFSVCDKTGSLYLPVPLPLWPPPVCSSVLWIWFCSFLLFFKVPHISEILWY